MSPPQPPRILVIDDDLVMRDLLSALFAAAGHPVKTAESGEAAIAFLHSDSLPDVLLTDVQLPGLSGAALASRFRMEAPSSMLIGMSGSEPSAEVRSAFDAFLLKPFALEDFFSCMRVVQDSSRSRRSEVSLPEPLHGNTFRRLAETLPSAQLRQLYQLTLADVEMRLTRLHDAQVAGDLEAYRREAHALKGGCSMVGAHEIAQLASQAEAANPGALADTPSLDQFHAAAARLRTILSTRFMHNR